MPTKVSIGTIKMFKDQRGVIAPQGTEGQKDGLRDLYFEAKDAREGRDAKAPQFRVGQLVQFVEDPDAERATDIAVLSERA